MLKCQVTTNARVVTSGSVPDELLREGAGAACFQREKKTSWLLYREARCFTPKHLHCIPLTLLFSFIIKSRVGRQEPATLKKNDRDLKHKLWFEGFSDPSHVTNRVLCWTGACRSTLISLPHLKMFSYPLEGLSFEIILSCRGSGAAGTFDYIASSNSPDEESNALAQNCQRHREFLYTFLFFRLWDLTVWRFPVQWTR